MTTDVLKLSGDYLISARSTSSAVVTIDSPLTVISGNLQIIGTATNIVTTQTSILDNILTLNAGETNPYVTLGVSGLLISRGNNDDPANAATLYYNDSSYWTTATTGISQRGVFELGSANATSAIKIDAIRISGAAGNRLNIFGTDNPSSVLSVSGTTNYENNVIDDDDIPNKKYVDSKANANAITAKQLNVVGTYLTIRSKDETPSDPFYGTSDKIFATLGTATNVVFSLEGKSALIQGITISTSTINVNTINEDLILNPVSTGTGRVLVKSPLSLAASDEPAAVNNETVVYASTATGGGGTGLYFVNSEGTDELVSRRRAIIFGIIF